MTDHTALIEEAKRAMEVLPGAAVHQLPGGTGDGYAYGGGYVVSFFGRALWLGECSPEFAHALANAPALIERLIEALEGVEERDG